MADLLIHHGATKVWLVMRGPCRVKPFDVDLPWMGKFKNFEQAAFWGADSFDERLEKIKTARGGGSITPQYHKILTNHFDNGRLVMRTCTTLHSKVFDTENQTWTIQTMPSIGGLPPIDYIYYATGARPDIAQVACLRSMRNDWPISTCGGLPCLTEELKWRADVPLFITGALAGLQIGPTAGNLGGARLAAERIAWNLGDMFDAEGAL